VGDNKRRFLDVLSGANYQFAWDERTGIEYDHLRRPNHRRRLVRQTVLFIVLVTTVGLLGLAALLVISAR
jgi:hypothetical protein